jgi:hypothetical protein
MLIWGSGGKSQMAGDAGMRHCNVCGETRPFKYQVNYTMRHIWYLFRWATGRTYYQICSVCRNGLPVEKAEIDAKNLTGEKRKDPVPFFDRFGWAIGLGAVALFLVFAVVAGNADKADDAALIAAPRVGDIYTVNVEKFGDIAQDEGSLGGDYGAFRVAAVTGQTVTLDMPKIIYNRVKGVNKDIRGGDVRQNAYYDGQVQVPLAQMKALHSSSAIVDVDRMK